MESGTSIGLSIYATLLFCAPNNEDYGLLNVGIYFISAKFSKDIV